MTTAISNKLVRIILAALIIVAAVYPLFSKTTNAASLTALSDTMTRQQQSVASDHVIRFTTPTGVAAAETITINFNTAGFSTGSTAFGDVDFTHGATTGLENSVTLAGTCSGATWGATFSTNVLTLTSCSGTVTATHKVIITIGLAASGGANQITNPGSTGSKSIAITAGASDSGTLAVPILNPDQVTVSATVDPSITSTLSSSTCNLGTLSASTTGFCSYYNEVSTNATSGYASTILSSNTAGTLCSPSPGTCTNNIPVEGGNNVVTQGTSEYGVGTSKTSQTLANYSTCANNNNQPATALSNTVAKQYADATNPVSADQTTVCHAATISGTQPAGSYGHTVTHITTGTF